MNKHWLIIGLGAGVISLVIITTGVFDEASPQLEADSTQLPNISELPQPTQLPITKLEGDTSQALNMPESRVAGNSLEQANRDIINAQLALENAENELGNLESEMDEVERYIDNLEQRGEDLAKYAEEGMLLLGPIIEKYEASLASVEAAEEELQNAQAVLADLNQ